MSNQFVAAASKSPPQRESKQDWGSGLEAEMPEMNDTLLKSFSKAQKEYIIKHLYPELSKALVHFISEAKRHNQIDEKNTFGESPPSPRQLQQIPAARVEQEQQMQHPASSSAFGGGYKMGQTQPSNMQLGKCAAEQQPEH